MRLRQAQKLIVSIGRSAAPEESSVRTELRERLGTVWPAPAFRLMTAKNAFGAGRVPSQPSINARGHLPVHGMRSIMRTISSGAGEFSPSMHKCSLRFIMFPSRVF